MSPLIALGCVALAYLIGSIPTAYLVVMARRGIDIRTVGSGNVGATNAGRVLGRSYFWLVFLIDLLKGFLPTWGLPLALKRLGVEIPVDLPALLAAAAILGHSFPAFLSFRGGKGVSTSLGAVLALDPLSAGVAAAVFVSTAVISRYVSLSSVLGVVGFVIARLSLNRAPWSRENVALTVASLILAAIILYRHRGNLARIAAGTEPRVGGRRNTQEPSP
jgi:glycerol-3-phosphate acyltransferase PlsY